MKNQALRSLFLVVMVIPLFVSCGNKKKNKPVPVAAPSATETPQSVADDAVPVPDTPPASTDTETSGENPQVISLGPEREDPSLQDTPEGEILTLSATSDKVHEDTSAEITRLGIEAAERQESAIKQQQQSEQDCDCEVSTSSADMWKAGETIYCDFQLHLKDLVVKTENHRNYLSEATSAFCWQGTRSQADWSQSYFTWIDLDSRKAFEGLSSVIKKTTRKGKSFVLPIGTLMFSEVFSGQVVELTYKSGWKQWGANKKSDGHLEWDGTGSLPQSQYDIRSAYFTNKTYGIQIPIPVDSEWNDLLQEGDHIELKF